MKNFLPISITAIFFLLILVVPLSKREVAAQSATCSNTAYSIQVSNGLISSSNTSNTKFSSNIDKCALGPKTTFAPYKIPTYNDLKSIYYTQSKANKINVGGDGTQSNFSATQDSVYYLTGNLNLSGNPPGSGTFVVFIDGNLNINSNYTYGLANTGTVFVVKGNVNIDPSVTKVDAIIITAGSIYTAGATCTTSSVPASQLVINGSLVSLDETKPTQFCRTLIDNTQPAEKINHQVKYLVILRNLFSDTYQKWSEIDANIIIPTPTPTPVPTTTPTPTPTPSPTAYTIASGFSGTQGTNNWYYYYRQSGIIYPLVYATDNMTQYVGPNWNAGSWSWGAITSNYIAAGDGDRYLIYWKAPTAGSATITVTQTHQNWSSDGDGYYLGISYSPAVGQFPQTNIQEVYGGGTDQNTKTLTITKQMQGGGDTLVYSLNPRSSAYHDDANYTIRIDFITN